MDPQRRHTFLIVNRLSKFNSVTLAAVVVLVGAYLANGGERPLGDQYCGPRCVRFLLEWYGLPTPEISSLAMEMQSLDIESGTSAHDVAVALRRRGIHVRPVEIPAHAVLHWDSPVLVHLTANRDEKLGHFAVWLPSSTMSRADVWVGLNGVLSGPTSTIVPKMTNVVLLTSSIEIAETACAFRRVLRPSQVLSLIAVIGGLSSLFFPVWRRWCGRLFKARGMSILSNDVGGGIVSEV